MVTVDQTCSDQPCFAASSRIEGTPCAPRLRPPSLYCGQRFSLRMSIVNPSPVSAVRAADAGEDTRLTMEFPALRRGVLSTLQVNLGYRCNQACSHCHVGAGPNRTESMEAATVALIPAVLQARRLSCLDLTGGAPELHPQFRSLVSVDWQGRLHDCDFNQQLGLGLPEPRHLRDLLDWDPCGGPILVGGHCFGCTAGAGSSCGGSLA